MSASNPQIASNSLIVAAEDCGPSDCLRQTLENPAEENLLIITFTHTVDDLLSSLSDNLEIPPAALGIISAGEQMQSESHLASQVEMGNGVTVSTIGRSDFTGLDIALTEHLSMWTGNEYPTKICFYSLTPLETRNASSDTIHNFLEVVTRKVSDADASGYYHVNPAAHDEGAVARLKPLFDTIET